MVARKKSKPAKKPAARPRPKKSTLTAPVPWIYRALAPMLSRLYRRTGPSRFKFNFMTAIRHFLVCMAAAGLAFGLTGLYQGLLPVLLSSFSAGLWLYPLLTVLLFVLFGLWYGDTWPFKGKPVIPVAKDLAGLRGIRLATMTVAALCLSFLALTSGGAFSAWLLSATGRHHFESVKRSLRADGFTLDFPAKQNISEVSNAVSWLNEAAKSLAVDKKEDDLVRNFVTLASEGKSFSAAAPKVKSIVDKQERALGLVDIACRQNWVDWGTDWSKPLWMEGQIPSFSGHLSMARLLAARAILETESGRDAEALEDIRRGLVLARHIRQQKSLIGSMVAQAVARITLKASHFVFLNLSDKADLGAVRAELDRIDEIGEFGKVLELELLTESDVLFKTLPASLNKEFQGAGPAATVLAYPGSSVLGFDLGSGLYWNGKMLKAMHFPSYEKNHYDYGETRKNIQKLEVQGEKKLWFWSSMAMPKYQTMYDKTLRTAAAEQLARCALAALQFSRSHGRWPESINEIVVPGDAVIQDPFTGKPFKLQRKGSHLLIYSLGPDCKDDQAKLAANEYEPEGDIIWELR